MTMAGPPHPQSANLCFLTLSVQRYEQFCWLKHPLLFLLVEITLMFWGSAVRASVIPNAECLSVFNWSYCCVLHQVPSNSRDSLVVEENIDNSWFSLRLGGGGESTIEAVPTRSLSTSSHERPASSTQPASRDLYPLIVYWKLWVYKSLQICIWNIDTRKMVS